MPFARILKERAYLFYYLLVAVRCPRIVKLPFALSFLARCSVCRCPNNASFPVFRTYRISAAPVFGTALMAVLGGPSYRFAAQNPPRHPCAERDLPTPNRTRSALTEQRAPLKPAPTASFCFKYPRAERIRPCSRNRVTAQATFNDLACRNYRP